MSASSSSRRRTVVAKRALLTALAAVVVSLVPACESGEQPRPFCTVRRDAYAARYLRQSGSGACSELKGEVLGAQAYLPDPQKPGDHYSLAIQSEALGKRMEAGRKAMPPRPNKVADAHLYAWGSFSSDRPDDSNVCEAPSLSEARLQQDALPEVPASGADPVVPAEPAIDVSYKWSNVRSYVTTASTGVVWGGDLEYTRDGCTARYKVVALAPLIHCDKDGKPDNSLCGGPDPATGFLGSGLNPDVAVTCDPDLLLCVPENDFPSLR